MMALPATALASSAPSIEGMSVSHITEGSATLEAQINPHGLSTSYEFWLECQVVSVGTKPLNCEPMTIQGNIGAGLETSKGVSAKATGLQPNSGYVYHVIATNSDGRSESGRNSFGTLSSGCGCTPIEPNESEVSVADWETNNRYAEDAPAREAERQRAAEQAQREAKEREDAAVPKEPEASTQVRRARRCVVPSLIGDSLRVARRKLSTAGCRLGRVSKPDGHHRGELVITKQSVRAGHKLSEWTAVAVKLGAAR